MAGLCLSNVPSQHFSYLIGLHQNAAVTNKGANGYQADTIENRELGTPSFPLVPVDGFGTVIVSAGTNDMINLWKSYPNYYTTIATLVGRHIALLQDVHALEPHAKIVDIGVRDLGYNDSRISSDDKAIYADQIAQYDSQLKAWIDTQPYIGYMPLSPESSYPQFYASANTCGPWHPSAAAEPMYATAIESLLAEIPAQ
jgi:hypothetical protein